MGIGGAAGIFVGNNVAGKRGRYAEQYNDVNASIASSDKRISESELKIAQIKRSMGLRDSQIQIFNRIKALRMVLMLSLRV